MIKDNRRYYLDLKENSRGRFLRVSQTITRGGPRSQVAIPAQGMIEFRDALTDLLDEFSADEHAYKPDLPEGRHMHVDNKNFYFDIGQNNRGIYMRISEVSVSLNLKPCLIKRNPIWPLFARRAVVGWFYPLQRFTAYFAQCNGSSSLIPFVFVSLQVKTNFRTAITVPEKSWCRFRDIMADYCDKIKQADQIQQQPLVSP